MIFPKQNNIKFIYASSAATYGMGESGFEDNHAVVADLKPLNPYGASKNEFDKWVLQQSTTPPFWTGFKFFNVFGPNEYHKGRMASVIFHTFNQIIESGEMKLFHSHNPDFKDGNSTLLLDGQNMKLQKIHLDNMQMHPNQYSVDESHLTITNVPKIFELKTEVRIKPQNNTELEGLYKSGEILGVRLNTYHNLFFFISLVKQARKAIIEKRYLKFKKDFLKKFNSQ